MVSCSPGWSQTHNVARDILNSCSSCLSLPSAGISDMHHPHPVYMVLGTEPRASYVLGKHSSNGATSISHIVFCLFSQWNSISISPTCSRVTPPTSQSVMVSANMRSCLDQVGLWTCPWTISLIMFIDMRRLSLKVGGTTP